MVRMDQNGIVSARKTPTSSSWLGHPGIVPVGHPVSIEFTKIGGKVEPDFFNSQLWKLINMRSQQNEKSDSSHSDALAKSQDTGMRHIQQVWTNMVTTMVELWFCLTFEFSYI